jgi:hypothetical protein
LALSHPRLALDSHLIDRISFTEVAEATGLVPVALYGDYGRGEYLEESSPFMAWILEKAKHP